MDDLELRLSLAESIVTVMKDCPSCATCKELARGYFEHIQQLDPKPVDNVEETP